MGRSTVRSLPPQLVFPGVTISSYQVILIKFNLKQQTLRYTLEEEGEDQ
jgi:hypothetical protein